MSPVSLGTPSHTARIPPMPMSSTGDDSLSFQYPARLAPIASSRRCRATHDGYYGPSQHMAALRGTGNTHQIPNPTLRTRSSAHDWGCHHNLVTVMAGFDRPSADAFPVFSLRLERNPRLRFSAGGLAVMLLLWVRIRDTCFLKR
jgi:hypothetical protein